MKNGNLHSAKKACNDEFYTRLTDIEKEILVQSNGYRPYFENAVVYCNCDDARESNFFKFFAANFEFLKLKKLICTAYKPNGKGVILVYEGDKNGNRQVDYEEIKVTEMEGDGDFRSQECIELLKQADIVVTNPPFSLFREYIKQLMVYDKKFIIIGNFNAVTYKEIFPLIKDNKLWVGVSPRSMEFVIPNGEVGQVNACWFTNLQHTKRNQPLDLYRNYKAEDYYKYDNYNAIEVSKVCDIPMDYDGVMGVPITFLDKYCPNQFEILGIQQRNDDPYKTKRYTKAEYANANDLNARGVVMVDGKPKSMYPRILIRHKR